ncbi:DUF4177 domain-containing protein [Palleronia sp. LCG004]|uniref:DUF4177 domain-containing protein n=1 Tax=Palleronia sp. LCG004 TaxID=3079304 RepID=UPI002941FAE7|nr:DUF4177 domain-containing protein [Palleronia sp. LCG004]WOI55301.1 DUF4177 domain-containing protein [Palleronia sp. LCG004]
MSYYEYRVVPAPKDAPKAKGVKGIAARFSQGMEAALNAEGLDRWEYQRSETMQAETKRGLFRKTVVEPVTVLIFRRWVETTEMPFAGSRDVQTLGQARAEPQQADIPASPSSFDAGHGTQQQPPMGAAPTGQQQAPALSAQREPRGALRPVPGPARD